jgi:hypothetical protein
LAVKALGVDLHQDVDAVPGPFGDLGGRTRTNKLTSSVHPGRGSTWTRPQVVAASTSGAIVASMPGSTCLELGDRGHQASMVRRYIAWRNRHTTDPRLRKVIRRAEVIKRAKVA